MSEMNYTRQEVAMLERGYASVRIAADKIAVHISTIYRLIETDKLRGVKIGTKQYIEIKSILEHVGTEGAKLLGLTPGKK